MSGNSDWAQEGNCGLVTFLHWDPASVGPGLNTGPQHEVHDHVCLVSDFLYNYTTAKLCQTMFINDYQLALRRPYPYDKIVAEQDNIKAHRKAEI